MELPLKIDVLKEENKTIVQVEGEIDINTSKLFKATLADAIKLDVDIYLDLAKLEYIDSIGIGIIAVNAKELSDANLTFNIINTKPNILKLFEITKIDQILNIIRGNDNE